MRTRSQAEAFLRGACNRFGEPMMLWAREGRTTTAAAVIVTSEGKVGFVYHSPPHHERTDPAVLPDVIRQVTHRAMQRDTAIVQSVIDSEDAASARSVDEAGFEKLADLVHMGCDLDDACLDEPPDDVVMRPAEAYPAATLQSLVAATYEQSLDCPRLAGRRKMSDVMTSHRTTGVYTPASWHVAVIDGQPAGCIFANRREIEPRVRDIVYMGVALPYRGRGLGRAMLSHLADQLRRRADADAIGLAVDAKNTCAIRLYQTFGFTETHRRACWICFPEGPVGTDCA
ncbi:MAG: GNAT family N-acetyltransferase [Phycisphaerae bacterium]|nr:GNAT family N-acetyltransferase [Phycisphaerae bacterium]